MQNYRVLGEYMNCGRYGMFSGCLRALDDSRVIGAMEDEGEDIIFSKGKTKLILGLMENNQLNFWKFSPSDFLSPVVYALDKTNRGEYDYEGKWSAMNLPNSTIITGKIEGLEGKGLSELGEAFKTSTLEETLNVLEKIEKSRIEPYLPQEFTQEDIKKSPASQQGHLVLSPVDSFKVSRKI